MFLEYSYIFHFKVVPVFKAEFPVDKRKMDLFLNPFIQLVSFYWRMKDVDVGSDSKRCVLAEVLFPVCVLCHTLYFSNYSFICFFSAVS